MNILQAKEETLKLLLRFLANLKNKSWLSRQVQAEIKNQYPQLSSVVRHQRLEPYKKYLPRWPVILTGLLFPVFVLINELLLVYFGVLFPLNLNSEQVNSFLTNLIVPLAAILGVVILLIILLVEFLGRDYSNVIDIYLDKVEIHKVAVWALVVLGLYGITIFIVKITSIIFLPRVYLYVSLLFMMLTLAILIEVGLALFRVKHSLSYDFIVQSLQDRIYREVAQNQFDQARYRYLKKAHQNLLKSLDIPYSPFPGMPEKGTLLVSLKTGFIIDVHTQRLEQFSQLLQKQVEGEDSPTRGYMLKQVGDFIKKGDALVHIGPDQAQDIHYLQKKLNRSLKIKDKFAKSSDISRLQPHLKQITLIAVREENETLFNQLLDVYINILGLGIGLPTPPSTDFYSTLFPGWNVTNTLISHLRSIIEVAAQSKNDHFIRRLAYQFSIVIEAAIQQSDIQVSDSVRDILGLFAAIYFYSKQHANQLGIERSFSYLTRGNIVDIVWINKLEKVYTQQEALHNLKRSLGMIYYDTLSNGIVHSMLEFQDLDNLETLLNRLQVDEFFAPNPIWQQLENEKWDIERKLRYSQQEEIDDLGTQWSILKLATETRQNIEELFNQLVFVAASYTLDRYNRNVIDSTQVKKTLNVLRPYYVPFNQLAYIFKKLTESEGWTWRSFHRHPDTKHAYFPDDEAKYYLFYCLRGIEFLANGEIPDNLPLIDLHIQLSRIENFCNSIAENPSQWTPILEENQDIPALAQQFIELNKQIAEKWQLNKEEEIIKADLDPVKVKAFEDAFWEGRNNTSSLRAFLEPQGRVLYGVKIRSKKMLGFNVWEGRRKEYFSVLYSDLTYAQQHARLYSGQLTGVENNFLVSTWLKHAKTVSTRKDWESLDLYLERAFKCFNEGGEYTPSLIIIPNMLDYYLYLERLQKFVNIHDIVSPVELPHLRGFYDEIPMLEWSNDVINDNILVVDTEKAAQLEIEYVQPEVKLLPESERKRILEKNSNTDEKQLKLAIWVNIREKARVELLDKNAIVRLPIKLPNKGRYKLGPVTSLEQAD